VERHHVFLRVHNPFDQRSQLLKGDALFFEEGVAVIDATNSTDNVAKTSFGMSASTPALDIRDRAVRRRSWMTQPVTPDSLIGRAARAMAARRSDHSASSPNRALSRACRGEEMD
jgi:hypothetical protein